MSMSSRASHRGRTVLVTGAGQGIGRAVALGFARRGARVGVLDVVDERAAQVAREIVTNSGTAASAAADVSAYEALASAVRDLEQRLGAGFDTVVNNAGISPKHDGRAHAVFEMAPEEWSAVVGVNLNGAFNTVRLLSPQMKAAGFGAIVNMSSIAARTYCGIVGVHYAATKAAIIGFTRHVAGELGPYGIRVNAIAPGRIETPLIRTVGGALNEETVRATPMGRLGQPEEVADLALYLTSDEASFVTGQTVDVAGGWCMT